MATKDDLLRAIDDLETEFGGRKDGDRRIPVKRDRQLIAVLRQIAERLPE